MKCRVVNTRTVNTALLSYMKVKGLFYQFNKMSHSSQFSYIISAYSSYDGLFYFMFFLQSWKLYNQNCIK